MSISQEHSHPLLACIDAARGSIAGVSEVQPVYLTPAQKKAALVELVALEAQVAEAKLRVLAASDDLAQQTGARDAGQWLAQTTRADKHGATGQLRLAKALDEKYVRVGEAMRSGVLHLDQARVIVHALDALPLEVDRLVRKRAERDLVSLAKDHNPADLRRLGQRILDIVAPEIADETDARALEREERRARIKTALAFHPQGDGTTRITGLVPDAVAARLQTYLDAFTSPRVSTGSEVLPRSRRLGQAFCALLEHLDPANLPAHGGDATVVMVTIDHDQLTADLATAGLMGSIDGEVRVSATEARRLACTAKIIPAVLGGKGEILDLGRAQRLYNAAQRKALRLRDEQCRAEDCSIPATWCEAHHTKPWSTGGKTDLADGVLLCSHHHHLAHDQRYAHDTLASGDWRFHRRT